MKLILIFLSFTVLLGCANLRQYPLTTNYDTHGRFGEYSSFQVTSNPLLPKEVRVDIDAGISASLKSMGYKEQETSPSLYVYYQIYPEDIKIKTIQQVPLANAMARRPYFEDQRLSDKEISKLIPGPSLMICLYDSELKSVVWRGYIGQLNQRWLNVQAAAQLIMNEFPVTPGYNQSQESQYALR